MSEEDTFEEKLVNDILTLKVIFAEYRLRGELGLVPEIEQIATLNGNMIIGLDLSLLGVQTVIGRINKLLHLEKLELYSSGNHNFNEIETSLEGLQKLKDFRMINTMISELPIDFLKNSQVEYLHFENNPFTMLPTSIGQLDKVKILKLSRQKITELPDFSGLVNLTELVLENLEITKLPNGICKLTNLEIISVKNCKIDEIPSCLSTLNNLKSLSLDNTEITEVSTTFSEIKNLESLVLKNSKITYIDSDSFNFDKLLTLNLDNNHIVDLRFISKLKNLKNLEVSNNRIHRIGNEFMELTQLQEINLEKNPLKSIDDKAFSNIDAIEKIDLRNTCLTELTRSQFGSLDKLQQFALSGIHTDAFDPELLAVNPRVNWILDFFDFTLDYLMTNLIKDEGLFMSVFNRFGGPKIQYSDIKDKVTKYNMFGSEGEGYYLRSIRSRKIQLTQILKNSLRINKFYIVFEGVFNQNNMKITVINESAKHGLNYFMFPIGIKVQAEFDIFPPISIVLFLQPNQFLSGKIRNLRLLQQDSSHYKDVTTHVDPENLLIVCKIDTMLPVRLAFLKRNVSNPVVIGKFDKNDIKLNTSPLIYGRIDHNY